MTYRTNVYEYVTPGEFRDAALPKKATESCCNPMALEQATFSASTADIENVSCYDRQIKLQDNICYSAGTSKNYFEE